MAMSFTRINLINIEILSQIKKELKDTQESSYKHFAKQGSFALYYSKDVDYFVKKAYDIVLENFFEDFLPNNVPFCICASKSYASFKLCPKQELPLLFIYKDLKAYKIRQIIKAIISLLGDLGYVMSYEIKELSAFDNDVINFNLVNTRFLCGSKLIFKIAKTKIDEIKKQKDYIKTMCEKEFNLSKIPFIRQEFNIKKDFGGLSFIYMLDIIFKLYKDKISENFDKDILSKLRLCSDFLLSLSSAMNLQNDKESDIFLLEQMDELSTVLLIKSKKNKSAKEVLLTRAMSNLHFIGIFCSYVFSLLDSNEKKIYENLSLTKLMQRLCEYKSKEEFKAYMAFEIKKIDFDKDELLLCYEYFLQLLYNDNSFYTLKLLLDSDLLKEFLKPFYNIRFLIDFEREFSLCENAFLCLKTYEENLSEFKDLNLSKDETMILKLSILLSSLREENELSLANVFRSYCAKLDLDMQTVEFGLVFCKNYFLMRETILKEDIYNETVIFSLTSKLKNERFLKILHKLSLISAIALKENNSFFIRNLNELLKNCLEALSDENFLDESFRRVKKEQILKRSKIFTELDENMQDKIRHIKSNLFFIKHNNDEIVNIALLARKGENFILNIEENFCLEVFANRDLRVANILKALSNLNLINMSFYELFDEKIYIKFIYDNLINKEQKDKIYELLKECLKTNFKMTKKPTIKKDELKFDLAYSKNYVKLNLNSKDTKGLMAFVMDIFANFGIILSEARIKTVRQRTRNTFIFEKNELFLQKKDEFIKSLTSE